MTGVRTRHYAYVRKDRSAPLTVYSAICPHCQARWGSGRPSGFIDIERCPTCPQGKRHNDEAKEGARGGTYYRRSGEGRRHSRTPRPG